MKKLAVAFILLLAAGAAQAQDAYIEMLRSDVRAEKRAIIEEAMEFTPEEAKRFWPVYQKYERELKKINNARLKMIKDYAENYYDMTDDLARKLALTSAELDIKRAWLRKDYFRKFDQVLSSTKVVRFFQIEHDINLLIDLQIASEIPLIK